MGANYFTPKNAWRHLFFIKGLTADEFYTDGGLKLNIEQLTQLELKRSGYERVVFYDKDEKLYCYDEESYALLRVDGASRPSSADAQDSAPTLRRQSGGLKRGKLGKKRPTNATPAQPTPTQPAPEASEQHTVQAIQWSAGEQSGIGLKTMGKGPLHLGMVNSEFVKRQIDAYMHDAAIKTAVVINDPDAFLQEFGNGFMHNLTAGYERMGTDNENIMVFLYTDESLGNVYQVSQFDDQDKEANLIQIACPNTVELRNLLTYFRLRHGLKLRASQLDDAALALRQAMAIREKPVRIKELYACLKEYGDQRPLMPQDCYQLVGVKEPVPAKEQLAQLIGMQEIKQALGQYDVGEADRAQELNRYTASRLQPDLPCPAKKEEMIHFILTGNPGTGKTTAAKLIGQLFFEMGYLESGHVVETDRSELVSNHVGETALWTRQKVMEAMGGVLFIDEAYTLKRQRDNNVDFGQEAIDTLVKLMDQYKGKFIVVAAGYPKEMALFEASNPGLSGRFRSLCIADYTPAEMEQIVAFHARKNNAVLSDALQEALPNFCENWVNLAGEAWNNAREAVNLMDDMVRNWKRDDQAQSITCEDGKEYRVLELRHIPEKLAGHLKPAEELRTEALNRLNQMTGLTGVKETVERLRRRMLAGDMREPGHYLFTGNPGTGKTTVARYMGQILRNLGMLKRGHLVEFTASALMSQMFNEEHRGDFYETVKHALDGVLFIDEAYQLATDTTGRGRPVLDALLPFMENNRQNICVIVAGYEDEMRDFLDHNVGFQSRFTENIHFDNYTGAELHRILLEMLAEKGIEADEDYQEYALRALTRYVDRYGKEKSFGNARYVRTEFLPDSLDAQTDRLIRQYGEDFPRELKRKLTGADIPPELVRFTKRPLKQTQENQSDVLQEIDKLIGFAEVKQKLKDLLALKEIGATHNMEDLLEDMNLHWVLRGNPGTGKTTVAALVGKVYRELGLLTRGHTVKVTRQDLVAEYVGQTAVKTQRCIDRAMGGVLFIDEAYALKRTTGTDNDYGQEAIDTILEQMSAKNGEFAVIAAGYPREMEVFLDSNPGFESRFEENFLLPDYTAEELSQIFRNKCKGKEFTLAEDLDEVLELLFERMIHAKLKNWANGREAENLEKRMRKLWARDPEIWRDERTQIERRVYALRHLPEQYRAYLPTEEGEEETEAPLDAPAKSCGNKGRFQIPAPVLAQPEPEVDWEKRYLEQVNSVVYILAKSGQRASSGSGSILTKSGYILTCNHVVADKQTFLVRLKPMQPDKPETVWSPAEVVWTDTELDAAILKIVDGDYPTLPLRPLEQPVQTGESIYHWGYPFGGKLSDDLNELQPSLFQGYISSIQTKNGLERINTNMEAKRGCSGGPVFSKKDGSIIGILCGSQTSGNDGLIEEINYVLPVRYLWERVIAAAEQTEEGENANE